MNLLMLSGEACFCVPSLRDTDIATDGLLSCATMIFLLFLAYLVFIEEYCVDGLPTECFELAFTIWFSSYGSVSSEALFMGVMFCV